MDKLFNKMIDIMGDPDEDKKKKSKKKKTEKKNSKNPKALLDGSLEEPKKEVEEEDDVSAQGFCNRHKMKSTYFCMSCYHPICLKCKSSKKHKGH